MMTTDSDRRKIDFVPSENRSEVIGQACAWLKENAFMALTEREVHMLDRAAESGASIYLTLGGSSVDPRTDRKVTVETCFNLDLPFPEIVEDPEGTYWRRTNLIPQVSWGSWGTQSLSAARQRAALIQGTVMLAERFEERFGSVDVWSKGATRAERLKQEEERKRRIMINKLIEAAKVACKGAQVNAVRRLSSAMCPAGVEPGRYTVTSDQGERNERTYMVTVTQDRNMEFKRTK